MTPWKAGLNKQQPVGSVPPKWRMPPELDRYLPREVALSAGGRVVAGLTVLLLAGAIGSGVAIWTAAGNAQARLARLEREGVWTTATVVATGRNRDEEGGWFIRYQYDADGGTHTGQARLRRGERMDVGTRVPVHYLREAPDAAWPAGHEPRGVPAWLAFMAAGTMVFGAVALLLLLRKQLTLLAEGRAVEARVVRAYKVRSGSHSHSRAEYEFRTLSGAVRRIRLAVAGRMPEAGSVVTMLYDRDNPGVGAVYPLPLVKVVR